MLGEREQRERFAYALQKAMEARKVSARQLAKELGVDPRRIYRWLQAKDLPNLYEGEILPALLGVKPELFKEPPAVPVPPPYPLDEYLIPEDVARRTDDLVRVSAELAREDLETEAAKHRAAGGRTAARRAKRSA